MATAPDESNYIESIKNHHQNAWAKCLHENDDGEFCRIVARELNKVDPKWGLNAKRDGPAHDISKDALAYWIGPTDRHVEVFDFIMGHEAANAHIGWLNQTNYGTMGRSGTARFVHPVTGEGYSGKPEEGPIDPPKDMITVDEAVKRLNAEINHPITANESVKIADRARALGWDNGPLIAASIIDQIIAEMNDTPVPSAVTIVCKVTEAGGPFAVGTTIKILVG